MIGTTLLEVRNLTCDFSIRRMFGIRKGTLRALDNVSFSMTDGEVLGIVGETGSGKSTLAKTIAGIVRPTSGTVSLFGNTISSVNHKPKASMRARLQYVYQDPRASLDPRWTMRRSLHEPLIIHGRFSTAHREARILEITGALKLAPALLERYPHELSGGQQRRMGLARVLVLGPDIVILDEPTSGLDVRVQASVLCLLRDLRRELNLTYLLVSHDIAVIGSMCDRVAVMHDGKVVEIGQTEQILKRPAHPYTQLLLKSRISIGAARSTDRILSSD